MTLTDLEFKAEDFEGMTLYRDFPYWDQIRGHANRILKEKLEKAPEVFEVNSADHVYKMDCCVDERGGEVKIARARLVCIEEIK